MQANMPDLERSALANINTDEFGRVLVKYVDVPQAKEKQSLPDGGREAREYACHGVAKGACLPLGRHASHVRCEACGGVTRLGRG